MERTIAVEEGLKTLKNLLESKGYQVVGLKTNLPVDAAVVTGMDNNLMNQQNLVYEVPVINAAGRGAAEVVAELERKLLH
jgi:hypothetical protein